MSLYQDFESTYDAYLQRFKSAIPPRVARSMPTEELLSKMKAALSSGQKIDWGIEEAPADPNSLLGELNP